MKNLLDRLSFFGHEIALGVLIALLSIIVALASYHSAIAGSEETKHNMMSIQAMTDANGEYVSANQFIIYDYTLYDSYYTSDLGSDKEEYYLSSFSETLLADLDAGTDLFSEAYYDAMYAEANDMSAEATNIFRIAQQFSTRGDLMQYAAMFATLGLVFAGWASLNSEGSRIRLLFGILASILLVVSIISYLMVPTVVGMPGPI
jgi:hypothetical protein